MELTLSELGLQIVDFFVPPKPDLCIEELCTKLYGHVTFHLRMIPNRPVEVCRQSEKKKKTYPIDCFHFLPGKKGRQEAISYILLFFFISMDSFMLCRL